MGLFPGIMSAWFYSPALLESRRMKIVFLCNEVLSAQVPFGITSLAAMALGAGHEVEYVATHQDFDSLRARLEAFRPDVLAYSSASGDIADYLEINRRLRPLFPGAKSVFGGPHPTLVPEQLIQDSGVDALCVGEGDEAFCEYLDALAKGTGEEPIRNFYFKSPDGKVISAPPRPFIQDLDALPFPDYGFVDRFENLKHSRVGFFMAGRGCPYKCTYCINNVLSSKAHGKYVRWRSPGKVCDEIVLLRERRGLRFVNFQDDTFASDVRWLREFAPLYRERIGLPYLCHVRANLIVPEVADLLQSSGCFIAVMGLESGSERLRKNVLRRAMTNHQIETASHLLRERGIKVVTQNMIGLPDETIFDALDTLRLNRRSRVFATNFWFFQPYPMLELTRYAQERGQLPPDYAYPKTMTTTVALMLPDKELLERLGRVAYWLVDRPDLLFVTQMLSHLSRPLLRYWLRALNRIKPATHDRLRYDHFFNRMMREIHEEPTGARASCP